MDFAEPRLEEPPELSSRTMGKDRPVAAREESGHPAAAVAQVRMADRVDTAVDAVKTPRSEAVSDLRLREPCPGQLGEGDRTPLPGGDLGDRDIEMGGL